jgi:signal transduction histidine kinase
MPPPPAEVSSSPRAVMRRHVLFSDLSESDFERIYSMAEPVTVPAGKTLFAEGDEGDALYIVLGGELEISRREAGREVTLATRGPGDFVGELSLLQVAPRSASARALSQVELLAIRRPAFQALLACGPSATLTILATITSRLRSTEALLKQQEKMAALGTLAAGLAHELNNPAAAIRRSMDHLRDAVAQVSEAGLALDAIDPAQRATLDSLRRTPSPGGLSTGLARARREETLQDWLEDNGLDRAWELAPVIASMGIEAAVLDGLATRFARPELHAAIRWLAANAEVDALVAEAAMGASAISSIVSAVKSYARLDQAPIQQVDVHETLESTLVMLKHKLGAGMNVSREYAPDLPAIEAYGSELAQVWTNLVDNAIDATGGRGNLVLRTRAGSAEVVVEVVDDGPGIPAENQSRLFDPFFTTKPPGKGTGLGLHIARNIVVERHRGQISLDSRPGRTAFTVRLPLRLPARS